jgi:hypothetical protein
MRAPVPWNQRELQFGRSLDELPVLIERIHGTPARLSALLREQPLERVHLRVEGRWSVIEHTAHLIALQDRFEPRAEDFEHKRDRLCEIRLDGQDLELRKHRVRRIGDVLEEFRLKRQAFTRRVDSFAHAMLEHVAVHPCKGRPMRAVDMLHWIAEHDDHHLATIRHLLNTTLPEARPAIWPG